MAPHTDDSNASIAQFLPGCDKAINASQILNTVYVVKYRHLLQHVDDLLSLCATYSHVSSIVVHLRHPSKLPVKAFVGKYCYNLVENIHGVRNRKMQP